VQILFKRGNTAQNDTYTGPLGSISIDTQLRKFRIHDGVTAGGKVIPNMDDVASILSTISGLEVADIGGLQAALDGKANSSHTHAISDITGLQSALDAKVDDSEKGAANGVATLDSGGKVPAAQLPSFVDDVLEYADLASFPATGETGKIYVAFDTSKIYRWSGSVYIEISPTAGNSDSATKLATARTISATGDASWSVSFDGSDNSTAVLTLTDTGVGAGTYKSITVDSKGRVTAGTNPTTLAGFGITDATPSSHIGTGGTSHANATGSVAGFMSSSDKSKLDGIASGAQVNTVDSVAGKTGAVTLVKADVGLGSVDDYATASQVQAENASDNDKFMTPLRTKELIEAGNFTLDAGVM
jgi:phage-related tail fiber protein